jgi:VWFA-related protein
MSQRSVGPVCCGLLMTFGLVAPAPSQEDLSLFYDTVEVHVINIEVMVTDAGDQPVTGLTRQDFQVYEDGEPVELSNFFAVEDRKVVAGAGAEVAPGSGGVAPTPRTRRLHLVVFIDNLNIRPEHRNRIFDNLRQYLSTRLDPRDRVMLVALNDRVEVAQKFTNDPERLLATLNTLEKRVGRHVQFDAVYRAFMNHLQRASLAARPQGQAESTLAFDTAVEEARKLAWDVKNLAEQRVSKVRGTAAALEGFADSLAGLRGRKALLYVSDGVPLQPAAALVEAWFGKYDSWIMTNDIRELSYEFTDLNFLRNGPEYDGSDELRALVEHSTASGVAFYPISIAGQSAGGYISAEYLGSATGGGPGSLDVAALEAFSHESSLLQLAEGTGGLAFTRSANISGLMDQVTQDFETFYSLGYSPPGEPDDAYHEIEVKLKDRPKGFKLRYLKGRRQKDPLAHLQDLTLSALHYEIEENPLGMSLDPVEEVQVGSNRYRVSVMVKVPFERLLLLPQGESHAGQVSAFVVAGDEKGRVSPFQRIELPIRVPNEQILQAVNGVAGYPLQLEMRKGRQRIAVGIRDRLARIDSTVCLDLTAGDGQNQAGLSRQAPAGSLPER